MDHIGTEHTGDMIEDLTARLKKLWPKHTQDQLATGTVLILLPSMIAVDCMFVLPKFYSFDTSAYSWRLFLILYFAVNVYINLYKLISVGPNGNYADLPSIMRAGFKYCHICRLNAPPRAHHCPLCDKCVFKRDHHCSFGAVCVGHFNHRYFIAGTLHACLCIGLLLSWKWWLLLENLGGLRPGNVWMMFMPHLAFLFRFVSIYQFICVAYFAANATAFAFAIYLLAAQAFCIYRGQTRIEFLLDVKAYDMHPWMNWKQCMGRKWFLALIFPLFNSPLDSDGISFPVREGRHIEEFTKSL